MSAQETAVSLRRYRAAMPRDRRPAALLLRMAPQLRDGLRAAAAEAGCSVNAFAVQVLAAAAGDPSRFRGAAPADGSEEQVRELERDELGYPIDRRARQLHIAARSAFLSSLEGTMPASEWVPIVKRYDAEDPAHFVEWYLRRQDGDQRAEAG
jgi:HicB family